MSRSSLSKSGSSFGKSDVKNLNLLDPEKAKEFEVAMQWYRGELDSDDPGTIHLLVALNNKSIFAKTTLAQQAQTSYVRDFIISKTEITALHENLVTWIENEEAAQALQDNQPYTMLPADSPSRSPNPKSSKLTSSSPTKVANQSSRISTAKNVDTAGSNTGEEVKKRDLSALALALNHLLVNDGDHTTCDMDLDVAFEVNLAT